MLSLLKTVLFYGLILQFCDAQSCFNQTDLFLQNEECSDSDVKVRYTLYETFVTPAIRTKSIMFFSFFVIFQTHTHTHTQTHMAHK